MIESITSSCPLACFTKTSAGLTYLEQITCKAFYRAKDSVIQKFNDIERGVDFHPLSDPGNAIEGGVWTGFWGLCALFSAGSLYKLYSVLSVEHPEAEKFTKITSAVKTAFVDLISLGGATAYNIHWAHKVKIISLGQYAPLIKGLGYGASLVINTVEGSWSIYSIYKEKEAILNETESAEKEKHRQRLCLSLMKLISNVSMVAWAILGIAMVATSLTVSPILMPAFLVVGSVFSFASFFYQRHIENAPELCPLPKFKFLP